MKPVWAVIWPDGKVLADSSFKDEDHAWDIALGWPGQEEIQQAKADGYKAVQVKISIANGMDINQLFLDV